MNLRSRLLTHKKFVFFSLIFQFISSWTESTYRISTDFWYSWKSSSSFASQETENWNRSNEKWTTKSSSQSRRRWTIFPWRITRSRWQTNTRRVKSLSHRSHIKLFSIGSCEILRSPPRPHRNISVTQVEKLADFNCSWFQFSALTIMQLNIKLSFS